MTVHYTVHYPVSAIYRWWLGGKEESETHGSHSACMREMLAQVLTIFRILVPTTNMSPSQTVVAAESKSYHSNHVAANFGNTQAALIETLKMISYDVHIVLTYL